MFGYVPQEDDVWTHLTDRDQLSLVRPESGRDMSFEVTISLSRDCSVHECIMAIAILEGKAHRLLLEREMRAFERSQQAAQQRTRRASTKTILGGALES